jgi:energy-coupling factor transport system permease protein
VLARDARRFRDAQRCRPGEPASRLALARAVTKGALNQAVEITATLEVRGYGGRGRPARRVRPWSRHDFAFLASAIVLVGLAVFGDERFSAYPRFVAPVDASVLALAAALVVVALLPFADRRGVGR